MDVFAPFSRTEHERFLEALEQFGTAAELEVSRIAFYICVTEYNFK